MATWAIIGKRLEEFTSDDPSITVIIGLRLDDGRVVNNTEYQMQESSFNPKTFFKDYNLTLDEKASAHIERFYETVEGEPKEDVVVALTEILSDVSKTVTDSVAALHETLDARIAEVESVIVEAVEGVETAVDFVTPLHAATQSTLVALAEARGTQTSANTALSSAIHTVDQKVSPLDNTIEASRVSLRDHITAKTAMILAEIHDSITRIPNAAEALSTSVAVIRSDQATIANRMSSLKAIDERVESLVINQSDTMNALGDVQRTVDAVGDVVEEKLLAVTTQIAAVRDLSNAVQNSNTLGSQINDTVQDVSKDVKALAVKQTAQDVLLKANAEAITLATTSANSTLSGQAALSNKVLDMAHTLTSVEVAVGMLESRDFDGLVDRVDIVVEATDDIDEKLTLVVGAITSMTAALSALAAGVSDLSAQIANISSSVSTSVGSELSSVSDHTVEAVQVAINESIALNESSNVQTRDNLVVLLNTVSQRTIDTVVGMVAKGVERLDANNAASAAALHDAIVTTTSNLEDKIHTETEATRSRVEVALSNTQSSIESSVQNARASIIETLEKEVADIDDGSIGIGKEPADDLEIAVEVAAESRLETKRTTTKK